MYTLHCSIGCAMYIAARNKATSAHVGRHNRVYSFILVFWVVGIPANCRLCFTCVLPDAGWCFHDVSECREIIAEAFEEALRLALNYFSAVTISWG